MIERVPKFRFKPVWNFIFFFIYGALFYFILVFWFFFSFFKERRISFGKLIIRALISWITFRVIFLILKKKPLDFVSWF